jgi:hypothetical protein
MNNARGEIYAHFRTEALIRGLKFYYTGHPCIHGHLAQRHTYNGDCMECRKTRYQRKSATPPRSGSRGDDMSYDDLLDHPQWEIVEGAIKRYSNGERDADYTLGLIEYGFRLLNEARQKAMKSI